MIYQISVISENPERVKCSVMSSFRKIQLYYDLSDQTPNLKSEKIVKVWFVKNVIHD